MFNSDLFTLSLAAMAPILMWGIWIISEESFDELNSRNRWGQLQKNLFNYNSARVIRKKILPIYFLLITLLILAGMFLSTKGTRLLLPTAFLLFCLTTFISIMRRREKQSLAQITRDIESEISAQIQLLTILISSGISPSRSIELISERSNSVSSRALRTVVEDIQKGLSVVEALDHLKNRYASNSLRRFITSLILGIERGSALSPILISQVRDSRLAQKTEIMQKAGKAEIGLMIPVVFLILPISILFALWPSFNQLGSFL